MFLSHTVPLSDSSSTAEARRAGSRMAAALGLDETRAGEVSVIITEASRNAVVYGGGGGDLLLFGMKSEGEIRLDMVVTDKGPGIANLTQALEDGYSTGGTPGTGLGAIRRMADSFDLFSNSKGTAVFARIAQKEASQESRASVEIAGLAMPYPGEITCGDGVAWSIHGDRCMAMVVDGLGHGMHAAEAAQEAIKIFEAHSDKSPVELLQRLHDALRKTRGGVAAVAELRPLAGTLTYAGVGNIAASILSSTELSRSLVSHNGTLGHNMARVQDFKVDWPKDGILIMHSDGLQSRWDLARYPGLMSREPDLIAGVLLRDFRRGRDDASVLVVKGVASI